MAVVALIACKAFAAAFNHLCNKNATAIFSNVPRLKRDNYDVLASSSFYNDTIAPFSHEIRFVKIFFSSLSLSFVLQSSVSLA